MVYYVYIQPAIFATALANPPYGPQALIAALRGFMQNCCIMEFEDFRIQQAIGERVEEMEESHDRKAITTLLKTLAKRNRFLYCLQPDYVGNKADTTMLLEQAAQQFVDIALLVNPEDYADAAPDTLQLASLDTYQTSEFEAERSTIAVHGRTSPPQAMDAQTFLSTHFTKAIRHANTVVICDRVFGERYGGNFEYTIQELLRHLSSTIVDVASCSLKIHCGQPIGRDVGWMVQNLRDVKGSEIPALPATVQFYVDEGNRQPMPHDRFIMTDQFCISIGRGLDFLEVSSGMNRDVSINLIGHDDCQKVLDHYASKKTRTETL